jgi:hypothetical protein
LPDFEDQLLRLHCEYMTEFVRGVRAAANEQGERRGRAIQVSAWIEHSYERMLRFGCDGYEWIREGLLDFILTAGPAEIVDLARQHNCGVYFALDKSPEVPLEGIVQDAKHAWGAGFDGMAMWDLPEVQFQPERWERIRRLGHSEEAMHLMPYSYNPAWYHPEHFARMKRVRLRSIAGCDMTHLETRDMPGGAPIARLSVFAGG